MLCTLPTLMTAGGSAYSGEGSARCPNKADGSPQDTRTDEYFLPKVNSTTRENKTNKTHILDTYMCPSLACLHFTQKLQASMS